MHAGQCLDRMRQHRPSSLKDFLDRRSRHLAARHLNRRLDHRQRKALHPEAIKPEIAPLCRQQLLMNRVGVGMISEHVEDLLLRQPEHALIVPERIVRIESDCPDGLGHGPALLRRTTLLGNALLIAAIRSIVVHHMVATST